MDVDTARQTTSVAKAVSQWTQFLRQQNALYAELAARQGEPFLPIEAAEMQAAARLAATLGVLPPARAAAPPEPFAIAAVA